MVGIAALALRQQKQIIDDLFYEKANTFELRDGRIVHGIMY